ncbi:MAG: hypothetical protein ACYDHE_04790 [Candidatus Acidiferrales bacterium]
MTYVNRTTTVLVLALVLASHGGGQIPPAGPAPQSTDGRPQNVPRPFAWESPARLRSGILGGTSGTLRADSRGVEFVPLSGASTRWTFTEIKDMELQKHRVVLIGYGNRKWHLPGTQRFDLEITNEITPAVAVSLTAEMRRPVRNMLPEPDAPANTVIAVRRSDHFGGSNGLLRIRRQGIDYVTAQPGQSRSWRWLDLQTLSNPDPYHLLVFGYRDTYAFDLKETLSRELFNHVSDEIWRHNESEMMGSPVTHLPDAPTNVGRREDD